jgi:hypothetical protein
VLYSASRPAPSDSGGLHRTSAPPSPGALQQPPGSGGGSRPRSQPRSQGWSRWHVGWPGKLFGWLSVAIPLQPMDWHHPHVARAIRGCIDSSPHPPPPLTGFLCRSTACCAFVSSPTSSGDPSPPGASSPAHLGALDKWVECLVSR